MVEEVTIERLVRAATATERSGVVRARVERAVK